MARNKLGFEEENIILFFGLLRPYKGVKFLIQAFDNLPANLIKSTRLLIVGEAWEDQESLSLAEKSPNKEKISIINRYVADHEIPLYFSAADVLVLPYTRASQSGVAHIAMTYGLPIIATRVGGLEEGLQSYQGASFIARESMGELKEQLVQVIRIKGSYPFPENLSWMNIGKEWVCLFDSMTL
jgi:glycosyltransferase involved in cell wall biosynthesis